MVMASTAQLKVNTQQAGFIRPTLSTVPTPRDRLKVFIPARVAQRSRALCRLGRRTLSTNTTTTLALTVKG